jgi:hypothetical protein
MRFATPMSPISLFSGVMSTDPTPARMACLAWRRSG